MNALVRALAVLCVLVTASAAYSGSAQAQSGRNPPANDGNQALADLQARTFSLEETIQQLTGQIEELRYKNAELTRQLQQIQDDLTLRVTALEQAAGGAPKVVPPAPTTQTPTSSQMTVPYSPSSDIPTDGYNSGAPISQPVQKQPEPVPTPPSATMSAPPSQSPDTTGAVSSMTLRLDANGNALPAEPGAAQAPVVPAPPVPPPPAPHAAPNPPAVVAGGVGSGAEAASVDLPEGTPKQQYDFAFDFLKRQDYAHAEAAFRQFLKLHPKDPLAGNAQYWLGESLYVRGDYQQAAVEFMNGYENYPKSNKGPDNLLKLGMSMANLNQTQGACTALGRVAQEYPDASDEIRKSVQTERAKLKCS